MTSIETLDELIGRVVDEDSRKRDVIADTRAMSFAVEEQGPIVTADLADGIVAFDMNEHALGQISADLAIPKRYFDRMREKAPDLLRSNVQHWMGAEPHRRMIRGLAIPGVDDAFVGRAWMSDGYRRLDNIEIARTLLPEFENLGTPVEFHNAAVTESRFYLRALFPEMEREVKVNDLVRWGVEIRNSEVGAGKFLISGFVLRLVCTNGMTVSDELSARHVGRRADDDGILSQEAISADDTAFWLAARDTLRAAISETRFEEIVETLREATEGEEVERPIKASEDLAQRYSLTEEEREGVLLSLVAAGDMTRWGMLNAVTQTAQAAESFDRQAEMESLGWTLATLPAREWHGIATA